MISSDYIEHLPLAAFSALVVALDEFEPPLTEDDLSPETCRTVPVRPVATLPVPYTRTL